MAALLVMGIASCSSSYRPTRRTETHLDAGWPRGNNFFHQASYGKQQAAVPDIEGAELVDDDELCLACHQAYTESFAHNVHRGDTCESCHGPASRHMETRGKEPGLILSLKKQAGTGIQLNAAQRSEVCIKCHEQNACASGSKFRYSKHAACGVACTDCHTGHYDVPPGTPATTEPGETFLDSEGRQIRLSAYYADEGYGDKPSLKGTSNNLGAVAPGICYKCHSDMQTYQEIAGPHQICGPNGFNCTTCHDPHGKIKEESRTDLCLCCHGQGSPVMAWHSATHSLEGVACTDCHNPHPTTQVQRFVNISHTDINRPERRMMSVQEPEVCYKCHQEIFAMNALPSHHPIKEGHMVCSDCHDGHGQLEGNLKAEHITQLCWKCHADKQGPFAYEHPPVTEDCGICHEPHGTVADHLLKQPPAFLCLRCHVGHRDGSHGSGDRVNIDANPQLRPGLYTDCTTCHSQIHGSDLPSPHFPIMTR
ncbi:MAG: cytochrome c3 family protein [Planctomycetota bacterium]